MRQPLDYSSQGGPASNWPTGWYVAALVWAFVTLNLAGAATAVYREERMAEFRTQVALLFCAAARLAWARYRSERSRGWIVYVSMLVLAVPVWYLIAHPIARFAKQLMGGPLIP